MNTFIEYISIEIYIDYQHRVLHLIIEFYPILVMVMSLQLYTMMLFIWMDFTMVTMVCILFFFFVSVYFSIKGSSHRARIPSTLNWQFQINSSSSLYTLNISSGKNYFLTVIFTLLYSFYRYIQWNTWKWWSSNWTTSLCFTRIYWIITCSCSLNSKNTYRNENCCTCWSKWTNNE